MPSAEEAILATAVSSETQASVDADGVAQAVLGCAQPGRAP